MDLEALKLNKNRETLKPELEDIELLHSSVEFLLPPQNILNSNPDKKFYLKTKSPGNWPKFLILPQNENKNREVYISLNGLPEKNTYFSYQLSPNEETLAPTGKFTNFLESDARILHDKFENIRNSLLKADEIGAIEGWDAFRG